jgi:hypothetical protein
LARSISLADAVKVASTSISSFFCGVAAWCLVLVEHRFGQAAEARLLAVLVRLAGDLRVHQLHQLLQHLRLLPEHMKGLVEHLPLVAALHEHRMQRPVEVLARCKQATRHRGIQRIEHAPGPTGMPASRSTRAKCMMFSASLPEIGRRF